MSTAERVRQAVEPLLAARAVELVDLEQAGPVLRLTVDREGGIDLDTLSDLTRSVSAALDEVDPVPGRYTLEVSSPGLERPLRTPHHFQRAVGSRVKVKTVAGTEGERRVDGVLAAADDEGVTVDGRRLRYDEIERARTVFEWGPAPKPGGGSRRQKKAARASR